MYHRIDDDRFDPWGLSVSPDLFTRQMEWLARNRTVLPLADFAELHRGHRLPPDAVALTFDDGYASVAEVAVPVLGTYGLPATIFIPATVIETQHEFWWDKLARLILAFEGDRLSVTGKQFDLDARESEEADWRPNARPRTSRQRLFWQTWADIRTKSAEEIDRVLDDLDEQIAGRSEKSETRRLMSPQQVRLVNSPTVKIGSHALTHSSLPGVSAERKRDEIFGSVERCTALSGERPRTFAYPFGDYDDEAAKFVEECGFACACTTEGKAVNGRAPLSRLPRIGVGNWTAPVMERVLLEL